VKVDQVSSQESEDNLTSLANGRQPHFFKMKDNLNYLGKWKTTSFFWETGRLPQFWGEMEDNLNFVGKIEDDLSFKINRRRPQFSGKQKTTLFLDNESGR
jgi:hypothetical protein